MKCEKRPPPKSFPLRFREGIRELVEEMARESRRSVNTEIGLLLEEAIEGRAQRRHEVPKSRSPGEVRVARASIDAKID